MGTWGYTFFALHVYLLIENILQKIIDQKKIIETNTEFKNLEKSITCGKNRISEYDKKIPSSLTAEEILIRSGNIGSVRIGQAIGIEKYKKLMQDRVGEKDLVLIEKNQNEKSIGKDQNFFNVILNEKLKEGNLVPCVYIGVKNNMLLARRL